MYNNQVIEHYSNPENVRGIKDGNGIGEEISNMYLLKNSKSCSHCHGEGAE